jgi:hypothetical protein
MFHPLYGTATSFLPPLTWFNALLRCFAVRNTSADTSMCPPCIHTWTTVKAAAPTARTPRPPYFHQQGYHQWRALDDKQRHATDRNCRDAARGCFEIRLFLRSVK